jgi:hypothetical protein
VLDLKVCALRVKKGKKDMGIAIIRVEKITNSGSATGKTEHNYRLKEVKNADPNREHLNKEYINIKEENIWNICNKRIEDVGVVRVRKDAVRGMEFILTASPEIFPRDENGVAKNLIGSDYINANFDFLKKKYGDNLVAFTFHQDEMTPHIHAVVVPITDGKRLSAKKMFNPETLKELQTEYADAMRPFGLERGLEGSKATHLSMKQMYGLHNKSEDELQEIEKDITTNLKVQVQQPSRTAFINPGDWAEKESGRINGVVELALKKHYEALNKVHSKALESLAIQKKYNELKKVNSSLNRVILSQNIELKELKEEINDVRINSADIAQGIFTKDIEPYDGLVMISPQYALDRKIMLIDHIKEIIKEKCGEIEVPISEKGIKKLVNDSIEKGVNDYSIKKQPWFVWDKQVCKVSPIEDDLGKLVRFAKSNIKFSLLKEEKEDKPQKVKRSQRLG